jgi:hypothetical protein
MNRITLTDPRIKDGTMMYFDEYVVMDFESIVDNNDYIVDKNYNLYVNGVKLDRSDTGDLTKEDPDKYKTK